MRNVHVDGFLIDRRGRWHTVVVCGRRFDGGVVVHVHRQRRGVGQSCLVFDRIHHVIGARLLRSGEGERIVRHGHTADVLRFDVFADGQVGVVSGDVVLRHGHGCCGVGAQCDFVVARVYARVGAGCEYAYADLRLGSLAGPVFDGVCEGVRSCGVGISFVYQVGGVDFADASECRRLVAEAEQLHVVAVGVDAGQGDRDLDFLAGCDLRLDV